MRRTKIHEKLKAEINIVPFTDVLLVLLVIFMVTTPMMVQGKILVKLPKARTGSEAKLDPVTLTLTSQGRVFLNDQEVPGSDLASLLAAALKQRQDKTVIINADASASHGAVVKLLDAAKAGGAERLAIATQNEASK